MGPESVHADVPAAERAVCVCHDLRTALRHASCPHVPDGVVGPGLSVSWVCAEWVSVLFCLTGCCGYVSVAWFRCCFSSFVSSRFSTLSPIFACFIHLILAYFLYIFLIIIINSLLLPFKLPNPRFSSSLAFLLAICREGLFIRLFLICSDSVRGCCKENPKHPVHEMMHPTALLWTIDSREH